LVVFQLCASIHRELLGNLLLLQAVTVVCSGSTIVDHLLDFRIWTGVLHGSIFVAAANAIVRLLQILVSILSMTQIFKCALLTCIKPGFLIKSPGDDVDFARTQPLDSCICSTTVSVARIEQRYSKTTHHDSEEESLVQATIL
jgi:hypothetical protein